METFYTLFIATRELLTCRDIFCYGTKHDLTLEVGKEKVLTFPLPDNLTAREQAEICLGFNPEMVTVTSAIVTYNPDQFPSHADLTITIVPRDIGSTKIGITTPYKTTARRLRAYIFTPIPKTQLV